MIDTIKNLDFSKLSVADRLDLIGTIWDSISDKEESIELTDTQREELLRRKKYHAEHPDEFLTWNETKAQILNRQPE